MGVKIMNLEQIISKANSIAISGHVRPDGDCVGSCLGLYNYISSYYPDKEVSVYLEPISDKFKFLNKADEIINEANDEIIYDVYFILDCGSSDRIGFAKDMYEKAKLQCCIDHHVSNTGSGEYTYVVPTASSTSELVFGLLEEAKITKEIAECLYLGIAHDTGVFQYSNVAPSTMRAAATLLETGIQASKIIEDTYYEKTYLQNQMLGKAFLESELHLDNRCISYGISWEEMKAYGATSNDMEGVVSQMRNTQGVDVAVFMYALTSDEYKISLRSNDHVDASIIAVKFQGGGHKKAAGFSLSGTYEELLKVVLDEIALQYA
ncbi:MAG: bifunctional oligoribonuclease/PAP phosphatase NrnA [Eubacteriales bacterium]